MKKYFLTIAVAFICLYVSAQGNDISFTSADTSLQIAFQRAKSTALHFKGKPDDAVGPWYESALPPRFAFCMRDVSHQSLGAEALGLGKENKNMFGLFAANISADKDWCSYWEINRTGKPAPEDYRDDKHFWYNLNANFDVLNACWELYLWTGNQEYIHGKIFANFYKKTVNEFIKVWVLQPDSLLTRSAHPNVTLPYDPNDSFQRCRGLPSYSEGVPNIKMGADLVAAIYRGLLSYAEILKLDGNTTEAGLITAKAEAYRQELENNWWDSSENLYNTYFNSSGAYGKNEGETFLLWFDALKNPVRRDKTLHHLFEKDWNIENTSYFPLIMYQNGYWDKAYNYMMYLTNPQTPRHDYPEVSYGVIKGFVQGLMGIDPDARYNRLSTIYRNGSDVSSTMQDVPVLHTTVNLTHFNKKASTILNTGNKTISWRPMFSGGFKFIYINGKPLQARHDKNSTGGIISYTDVTVNAGQKVSAKTQ